MNLATAACYDDFDENANAFPMEGWAMAMNPNEQFAALLRSMEDIKRQMAMRSAATQPMKGDVVTLDEVAQKWFAREEKRMLNPDSGIKETTVGKYRHLYEPHIKPMLGAMMLSDIKTSCVKDFIADLESNYSRETVKAIKSLLSRILESAVEDEYIHKNPCNFHLRRVEKKHKLPATRAEIRRLIRVSQEDRLGIFVPIAANTGMRMGEVLALEWSDFDFKKKVVHVTKNFTCINTNGHAAFSTTKTAAGVRTIPMSDALIARLKEYRETQPAKRFVLAQVEADKPTCPSTIRKAFNRWKKAAKVRKIITPHSLRHYFCTKAYENNPDLETLRKITGHADISTLVDIYLRNPKISKKQQNTMRKQ